MKKIIQTLLTLSLCATLCGCATTQTVTTSANSLRPHQVSVETLSYLNQGKRFFEEGFYKKAMRELLPLACDGNPDAQYAVGYMYYYGYGVAQDTDVGYFWIARSASQGYIPAINAERLMAKPENALPTKRDIKRFSR